MAHPYTHTSAQVRTAQRWPLHALVLTGLLLLGFSVSGLARAQAVNDAAVEPTAQTADAMKPSPKIYKYLAGGTTSFSDRPPAKGGYIVLSRSCYACNSNAAINWHATKLHHDKYVDEINLAAQQFKLDPALVRAVIHAESNFNARARSHKGAIGLMQLMPATARQLGVADARKPQDNIRGGVEYLAQMLARFKNDLLLATAAYNAGPEAVQKYAGVPPYAETQVYVQRVRILHQRYKEKPQS